MFLSMGTRGPGTPRGPPVSASRFLLQKTTVIAECQRAQLDLTFPFAADASSEMLVVFVSLEVS